MDVSNPKSENYGKYMKIEDVAQLTRCLGDFELVEEFLRAHGISAFDVTPAGFRVILFI